MSDTKLPFGLDECEHVRERKHHLMRPADVPELFCGKLLETDSEEFCDLAANTYLNQLAIDLASHPTDYVILNCCALNGVIVAEFIERINGLPTKECVDHPHAIIVQVVGIPDTKIYRAKVQAQGGTKGAFIQDERAGFSAALQAAEGIVRGSLAPEVEIQPISATELADILSKKCRANFHNSPASKN